MQNYAWIMCQKGPKWQIHEIKFSKIKCFTVSYLIWAGTLVALYKHEGLFVIE